MKTLTELTTAIKKAQSNEALEDIILSIPKQSNGERTQFDAFWYINLNSVDSKKEFMLERLPLYINTIENN